MSNVHTILGQRAPDGQWIVLGLTTYRLPLTYWYPSVSELIQAVNDGLYRGDKSDITEAFYSPNRIYLYPVGHEDNREYHIVSLYGQLYKTFLAVNTHIWGIDNS